MSIDTPFVHEPQGAVSASNEASADASRKREIDILARTIFGEARGESVRGKEAVASVVLNRVRRARRRGGYWWGGDIESVCLKPWQFSCWNVNDPNRPKLVNVDRSNRTFQTCLRVARRAVAGTLKDPTYGATHYHTLNIEPPWASGRAACVIIGRHRFYNDVE